MKAKTVQRRPLHQQVVTILREEIAKRQQAGAQLDSEEKLAKRFSVSVPTIREALRALAQEGIIERRHGSGTYVKERSSHQHVGILVGFDISHPRASYFHLRIVRQLHAFFAEEDYRTQLYMRPLPLGETPAGEPTFPGFLEDLKSHKLSGVISVATVPHESWTKPLARAKVPLVGNAPYHAHGVGINYPDTVRKGMSFLLERGKRKIALIAGKVWKPPHSDEEYETFKTVLAENGVPVQERWISHSFQPSLVGAGWEAFREIWLASEEKPEALLVCDDVMFADTAVAIIELGIKVPAELLVITLANRSSGVLYPFHTVRMEFDPDFYAQAAGQMLIQLMNKKPVPEPRVWLPFRFVDTPRASLRDKGANEAANPEKVGGS